MLLEGQVRIPSGCAIAAVVSKKGEKMSGEKIIEAMKPMHDRSNGLGGGFAAYGIYPEHKEQYAFHMFFTSPAAKAECEVYLKEGFEIVKSEIIPTRKIPEITDEPIIWRYFVTPFPSMLASLQLDEKEFVMRAVTHVNTYINGAYVFSCGKNKDVLFFGNGKLQIRQIIPDKLGPKASVRFPDLKKVSVTPFPYLEKGFLIDALCGSGE